MNWNYITKTSPSYWRYQGIVLFISTLFMLFSVWTMSATPEYQSHLKHLTHFGLFILYCYQMVVIFGTFHVVCRGIYKYLKKPYHSKRKATLNVLFNAAIASVIVIVFDLLPPILGITPYNAEQYLASILANSSFTQNLILYWLYNVFIFVVWLALYLFASHSANYKKLLVVLKKQELSLLANKISPEFLFSTMDAIKKMIDVDEEKAAELVTRASELFRYNLLASKNTDALLNQEIDSLKNYLSILDDQNRAPIDIDVNINNSPEALKVPSMSLIFLVSFLLKSARQRDAQLTVNGYQSGEKYRIDIYHRSLGKLFLDTEHFDNVKERLDYLYKSKASLILARKGRSRKLRLELPLNQQCE